MMEVLPIRVLDDSDGQIFGRYNVALAKLHRSGIKVPPGVVVTAPLLVLNSTLKHFDLGHQELFEQSLLLVKKQLQKEPLPEVLSKQLVGQRKFLIKGEIVTSQKEVWFRLLECWLDNIKQKLWQSGFSPDLTADLKPQPVFFPQSAQAWGVAFQDDFMGGVVIKTDQVLSPPAGKSIDELVTLCDKKLLIPHSYSWLLEKEVKLIGVSPYISQPQPEVVLKEPHQVMNTEFVEVKRKVATKIFLNLSDSDTLEAGVDGIFIASENMLKKYDTAEAVEELLVKLLQLSRESEVLPILMKLADIPEQRGGVRGSLRLLHQKSLMQVMLQALTYLRHKRALPNIHPVIPFVRSVGELIAIKQELASKKIARKPSLKIWMEVAVPENITNLEDYIEAGVDGVILNLDELVAHLSGFDHQLENMAFYKKEIKGLSKFLAEGLKKLHAAKMPVLVYGSLVADSGLLEFLVEKWVWGVIVPRYEAASITDLLYQIERKVVLKRSG